MRRKKAIAILAAVLMGVGTAPAGVMAADSYKEAEKASFQKCLEDFAASYGESMANYDTAMAGSGADVTVTLDDAGKAILGMFAPVDVSWLQDAKLSMRVGMADNKMSELMDVYVNDTKICSLEYYIDMETMDVYMKIPELVDGYIKVNVEESAELAEEAAEGLEEETEDGVSVTFSVEPGNLAQMTESMELVNGIQEHLPDVETVKTLLDRYGTILLDNVTDGTSSNETLSAGDVDQECTVLEGIVSGKEAIPMIKEILNTAKADEELKTLIEDWTAEMDSQDYSYDKFLEGIESLEAELEADTEEPGEEGFVSKIWLDAEDNVVGRQISLRDETGAAEPLVTWLSPKQDSTCGFSLAVNGGDSVITAEGSGELAGDLLSGTYSVLIDDVVLNIDVKDYDTAAMEKGILNGTYTLSIAPAAQEGEEESVNPFAGLELVAGFVGDKENSSFTLTLNSAGTALASINVSGSVTDAVPYAEISDTDKVYDTANDADGEAFVADMNLDTITENLVAAGMPEDFIETLMNATSGSGYVEDELELEEAPAEDTTAESAETQE